MKLDRALQRQMLGLLAETYPHPADLKPAEIDGDKYEANLHYLMEHGLVVAKTLATTTMIKFGRPTITAAGMDFLADDGGMSAILGVVTVRLHDDTIRELIAERIQESDLPAEEKTGLLHQLKELRGESIKHLTMKLLDAGLENAPKAIPLIQSALESLMK